ncbi:MAG TPA: hypothetical protein VGV92_00705 [Gammaproteobacteria bacterium]|nr:hypothetical protein [Gammaproteobacteria bacterium]
MSNGMRWMLVIPGALFLLSLSVLVASYACSIMHANRMNMKSGQFEANTTLNDVTSKAQNISDFLDQQLTHTNQQIDNLSTKIKLAQTEPAKFFQKEDNAKSIAGMSAGVTAMKTETVQIGEQQKNIKVLIDELNQLKRELRSSPSTSKA